MIRGAATRWSGPPARRLRTTTSARSRPSAPSARSSTLARQRGAGRLGATRPRWKYRRTRRRTRRWTVAEELRFFLRTAAYTAVIGVLYWIVSYEWAGSVMLAFVAVATGLVVVVFFTAVRATRGGPSGGAGGALRRAGSAVALPVGFAGARGAAGAEPLSAGLEPI